MSSLEEKQKLYAELVEEFSELYERYRYLLEHEKPRIEPRYQAAIGIYEFKVNELKLKILMLKRKIQLIQRAINRREEINLKSIDAQIEIELADYTKKLDIQYRKIEAATSTSKGGVLGEVLSREDAQELKEIYRELVKKTHPDIHPDASKEHKEFFARVLAAYKNGDLDALRTLQILYDRRFENEEVKDIQDEAVLDEKIAEIQEQIGSIEDKIDETLDSYPFTLLEILEDRERVNEIKSNLEAEEEKLHRIFTMLQEKLDQMTRGVKGEV
jgi:hypothetical protein